MKKLLCILLSLTTLLLSGCSMGNQKIRFGAAGLGGMYYSFGTAFTDLASKENEKLLFEVKSTAGSAANLRLLSGGYIELGIAQADLVNDAYSGTGAFESKKYTGYKAIASLYTEACQIVVRDDSDIHSIDDLQGKTVSIGESESGTEKNAKLIFEMSGLPSKLVKTVNLDYTGAATKLQSGEIDAFFCTAGISTTVIEELARQCKIRFLDIDEKCIKKLTSAYSFYSSYTIPENTYTGQTNDVHTIGVQSVLLASDKVSDDVVKSFTALLFEHSQDIQYSISTDLQLTEQSAVQGVTVPFHPGAAAYYAEHNIDVKSE